MIDQIRANKLPSNMMQFAAKGALQVSADENIEILVHLARHNKVFGDLARITLAGWDEKASLAAASDPKTAREVLDYFIAPENLRPKLLPALLENPSVPDSQIEKVAVSVSNDAIATMLQSKRVRASRAVLQSLRSNPYLKGEEAKAVAELLTPARGAASAAVQENGGTTSVAPESQPDAPSAQESASASANEPAEIEEGEVPDAAVADYLAQNASEIAAEKDKAFHPVGGVVDLLGADYFPVVESKEVAAPSAQAPSAAGAAAKPAAKVQAKAPPPGQRDNTLQKINRLDVKGRIQLALKGNKEERSILIRDGTKVVALAVLEAPKITDGEVEKFALQKNVLEAVLRQIPLKRRFMKNYIVVRNLVSNPRTPLDLGLGLMKHLLVQDLKNLSANKEIAETVRKLALKMYKQKIDAANKK